MAAGPEMSFILTVTVPTPHKGQRGENYSAEQSGMEMTAFIYVEGLL